jgi:hypothetical protein
VTDEEDLVPVCRARRSGHRVDVGDKRTRSGVEQQNARLVSHDRHGDGTGGDFGVVLRNWVARADINAGEREGLTSHERKELVELRRHTRVLETENEILQRMAYFAKGERAPKLIYTFIYRRCGDLPVGTGCRVMGCRGRGSTRGGRARCRSATGMTRCSRNQIFDIHRSRRRSYGSPRVHDELRLGEGISCSRVSGEGRLAAIAGQARTPDWCPPPSLRPPRGITYLKRKRRARRRGKHRRPRRGVCLWDRP